LKFSCEKNNIDILIQGLEEYWSAEESAQTTLSIQFSDAAKNIIKKIIPLRGDRVKQYAVEFICQQLLTEM